MPPKKGVSVQLVLLMVLAMVLWGGGWPALKIVTESVDVEVVTFWRFLIMFLAFIPILVWQKKPLGLSGRGALIVVSSALLNIAFMFISFWGVKVGTAGAGGVIITTLSPVLTVLLGILVMKTRVTPMQWLGLAVGLAGGAVMLELWNLEVLRGGNLLFVLSALVWAVLTLLSQRSHLHLEPLHYSFLLSAAATAVMFVVAFPLDMGAVFDQDGRFWSAMLYLGVLGQTVASTIFFIASGRLGSGAASSYMFLVPLSALVTSYFVLGEVPSFWLLAGGTVSTAAIYMINKRRSPGKRT
jgi:drug/metabolite transporter (DMT)-like permease